MATSEGTIAGVQSAEQNDKNTSESTADTAGQKEDTIPRTQEEHGDQKTAPEDSKLKELIDGENTNIKNLACARCQSVVLRPGLAKVTQKEFFLPHMKVKSANQAPTDGETLQDFWLIQGMYTFENVGFTNTVQNIKYLTCADCEVGPIGCHELQDRNSFYVAVDRVVYT